jgi:hypothetical protein
VFGKIGCGGEGSLPRRDSAEEGSNLLNLDVADGFYLRSMEPMATLIGPFSDVRPLP